MNAIVDSLRAHGIAFALGVLVGVPIGGAAVIAWIAWKWRS